MNNMGRNNYKEAQASVLNLAILFSVPGKPGQNTADRAGITHTGEAEIIALQWHAAPSIYRIE